VESLRVCGLRGFGQPPFIASADRGDGGGFAGALGYPVRAVQAGKPMTARSEG